MEEDGLWTALWTMFPANTLYPSNYLYGRAAGVRLPGLHVAPHHCQLLQFHLCDIRLFRRLPVQNKIYYHLPGVAADVGGMECIRHLFLFEHWHS